MNLNWRHRDESGLTMVELLVAIGIFALIGVALSTILFSSTRVGWRTSSRAEVQGGARQTLSLVCTEMRQAGAETRIPPSGVAGIVSADSISIRFRADMNADGAIQIAEPSEDVTYAWSDATDILTRNGGSGTAPVLTNVTAFSLRYFAEGDSALTVLPLSPTDRSLVKSIQLSFTAEDPGSEPITLTSRITLRNR